MAVTRTKIFLIGAATVWLAATALGLKWMADYSIRPGETGRPSDAWPRTSKLPRDSSRFQLVVAVHPDCPCTRATIDELGSIVARAGDAIRATVVFAAPDGVADDARETELWQRAAKIPGVRLIDDADGLEVGAFAFRTSGETRLYRPDGSLCFHGGITVARGHVGDNPGTRAILANLSFSPSVTVTSTPVFGCSLFSTSEDDDEERRP